MLTLFVRFFLGIVVALFFRCITGLLNPIHRRGKGVKWGLVSYTAVMFSLATVLTGMSLDLQSSCYIDNRDFSGVEDTMPPGPFGYQLSIAPKALNVTPGVMFTLSNWLADGLLVSSLRSLSRASNASSSPNSIAATLSISRTPGSLPFPVSCTSALWVRI